MPLVRRIGSLESEICSSHIAARGGDGPWRAQRLVDRVCLQVGGQ